MTSISSDSDRGIRAYLTASAEIQRQVALECAPSILAVVKLVTDAFRSGGKALLCGNGGSAADCQHMATEFVSRLSKDFERPALPAIALTTDTSILTAIGNDSGFDGVFERQIRALGKRGDVLIAISTSGNSVNVLRAVQAARESGIKVVGLQGEGGALTELADCSIVIPSRDTQHIQEALLCVEHILCHLVEETLFARERR
jgi:D-sedoheptulose 7-phosphate isomerase